LRQRLFPLVPEHHGQSEEELQSLVRSPQFSQAVHSLDAAIRSGELGPLIAELGEFYSWKSLEDLFCI
jgi:hypothetical protein